MKAPELDDLLNDKRLTRLFSQDGRHCALQLWILQIKSDRVLENRIVYARLIPYSFSHNSWSGSDDDHFTAFGQDRAQLFRLSLYVRSALCSTVIRKLTGGETIAEISNNLGLNLSKDLKRRFGLTSFAADNLYRPVAYLLNRDALELNAVSSPHGAAGALSASVVATDKHALFRLGQNYSAELTKFLVNQLHADTGLDFGSQDVVRFGDLELMVFPTLDDAEKSLLHVRWNIDPLAMIVQFDPFQVPYYNGFEFRLSIVNGDQVAYSVVAPAERDDNGVFECSFELDEQLRARTDSTELEIYGFHGSVAREGILCCRWRMSYVREIHIHGTMIGNGRSPVKFDWLEKTVRPSSSERAKAVLTSNRGDLGFESRVGDRDADPWVPAYRDLQSLFERLHP